jgi:hypothetical protein
MANVLPLMPCSVDWCGIAMTRLWAKRESQI